MRLPVCVYFVVKHQPLNACWTALFIQIAPEPPPTIIMCSLATTCSFRSVAGLDQFLLGGKLSGEVKPLPMLNCKGMTPIFDIDCFDRAGPDRQERWPHLVLALPPVPRPGENLLPCDEYEPPDGQEPWQLLLRLVPW